MRRGWVVYNAMGEKTGDLTRSAMVSDMCDGVAGAVWIEGRKAWKGAIRGEHEGEANKDNRVRGLPVRRLQSGHTMYLYRNQGEEGRA